MTSEGGSHLKQGSRSAIFMAIIEDRVPSNARLFLVLVLFSPTTENTLSASAFEWATPGPAWRRQQASQKNQNENQHSFME